MQVKERYGDSLNAEQALTEIIYPSYGDSHGVIEKVETDLRNPAMLVIRLAVLKGLTLAELNALAGYDRFQEV